MGVVVLDGATVRSFVNDEEAFGRSMDERFTALDLNGDGVLSREELRKALETLHLVEEESEKQITAALYDSIFERFDLDRSGTVDRHEFREEMKNMMLAVADGLGDSPIQVVLQDDDTSFLKMAADLEASKQHPK